MRPKDERGVSLPPPHIRLDNVPELQQAGLFAMTQDPRSCALPVKRKLAMIDKVIDHLVDGDAVPKWVFAKDDMMEGNAFLVDLWRIAERAVEAKLQSARLADAV